ncbi:MAG: hypothetical protein HeimC3_26310 [Candidatus Heimdallarchaeota archaeon LC_3]|nr:MAG: hypothetical protein HeimC3_26310 [Candidatus Heimdallarchaeota archaeon LC_3]
MTITVAAHEFDGPFESTSDLKNRIGVYIIYKKKISDGKFIRKYVGYSENVRDRVEDPKHLKRDCWERETNNQPYYAVHYFSKEQQARDLETELINEKNTPCNDT